MTEWVLWGFLGQTVIRSSQISWATAELLRGIDDIAYLRWVTIGKELTVSQLAQEAIGLINYPSAPINFVRTDQGLVRPALARPAEDEAGRSAKVDRPQLSGADN
ncbi:MAG: hypothetical protein WAV67_12840 [Dokdonella sp.]